MKIGAIFPQTEIGSDPGSIRAYAQAVEEMGYSHVLAFDHVLGADPAHRPGWNRYALKDAFHEVFVLFGYLAAVTTSLEMVTGVLILPQRQTALVAKQAAEIDVLTGGKLRLGVGVGWNAVEYESLGTTFHDRGGRIEEQVELLRLLWTQESVSFSGRWHTVPEAGLNPLPVQRPIPIWMGGSADVVLRRIARMADGWFPQGLPADEAPRLERLRQYARELGRDPATIGIEARLTMSRSPREHWRAIAEEWRALGAGWISVNTMGCGFKTPDDHISALRDFMQEVSG